MLKPLCPSRRACALLLGCGLIVHPIFSVQAAGSDPVPIATVTPPPPQAPPESSLVLPRDQARLAIFLEETVRRVERRRIGWLRTPMGFFTLLMRDIQRESQRHLDLLTATGWQSSGAEAQQRLEKYKAKAQRIEAELHSLYPPLRPQLVENEDYRGVVQALESRKQLLDSLQNRTEEEQAEAQQLQELLERKGVLEERLRDFDAYQGAPYPSPGELSSPLALERHSVAALDAAELKADWRDKLKQLKLQSGAWGQATENLLLDAEKALNSLKELDGNDLFLLATMGRAELRQPGYLRLEAPRNRVQDRVMRLGLPVEGWRRNGRVVESLWRVVNEIRTLAQQRLQGATEPAEAAVYARIGEEGRPGLYRSQPSEREAVEGDPAQREPARRGPLASSLADHPKMTTMVEKLAFWVNRGERGALLWLQAIQRLQHSTALLENTLAVVVPTAAERVGQEQAATLAALLSDGYVAHTAWKTQNRGANETELYDGAKQQLAELEARYWTAVAKLFYPYEQGEQELQSYFQPLQEGAGAQARARHAQFQQVWREQQAGDQLPYLSQLELDHRWEMLKRKSSVFPYDEIILQLLAQEPLLPPDQIRIRRGLNQLLARPDWLRLRPQVESLLRTEPQRSYVDVRMGSLVDDRNGARFTKKLADAIQALARSVQPQSAPAEDVEMPAAEQRGAPRDVGMNLLAAPSLREEMREGRPEEEARPRPLEEGPARPPQRPPERLPGALPEPRPGEGVPEPARGHGL